MPFLFQILVDLNTSLESLNPWPLESFLNTQTKIDALVKSQKIPFFVIPSRIGVRDDGQAGIQCFQKLMNDLDPGFRRGDDFLRGYQNYLSAPAD
jgi:hypothetical protein